MKNGKIERAAWLPVALVAVGMMAFGTSNAAFISCTGTDYDISGKVSTATDCTILSPLYGSENDDVTLINSEGFFGNSDWLLDGKSDATPDGNLFDFSGAGGLLGSFTATGVATDLDIMMIFKDGQNTNLVGYLVSHSSGTWNTPFVAPPFPTGGQSKEVSHISVYYRESGTSSSGGGSAEIPEPGNLTLLGVAMMGGLLAWGRRRRSHT